MDTKLATHYQLQAAYMSQCARMYQDGRNTALSGASRLVHDMAAEEYQQLAARAYRNARIEMGIE